jgi:microcystin-dependent protein
MAVLSKGTDFGATEQVTSGKLDNLVDAATFVSGGSGTCETGGGLNLSSNGRLQIEDGEIDLVKLSTNNALNSGLYGVLDKVYPIGSIYQSTSQSTSPDNLFFGGTGLTNWTAVGEGRVLVGKASSGTFDTAGATAGAETITLTSAQSGLPAHYHRVFSRGDESTESLTAQNNQNRRRHEGGGHTTATTTSLTLDGETGFNTAADAASAHSNLQPYEVVYMWKRVAL